MLAVPKGNLELTSLQPEASYSQLSDLHAVVRLHGLPIGDISVPAVGGTVTSVDVGGAVVARLLRPMLEHLALRVLSRGPLAAHPVRHPETRDAAWERAGRRADLAVLLAELDRDPPAGLPASSGDRPVPADAQGAGTRRRLSPLTRVAVRTLAADEPLKPLGGVAGYSRVRLVITRGDRPFAHTDVVADGAGVAVRQLRDALASAWISTLLEGDGRVEAREQLGRWIGTRVNRQAPPAVSVIVATLDRPDDLRICLTALAAQRYDGRLEVVVVDNAPGSGLTPPVVAAFPGVRLVSESRRGLSYARNAGFRASSGDLLATTDDDVQMGPEWVAHLVGPFVRPDVAVVTGNTLPSELDTPAQQRFEMYGGLGRGYSRREFDRDWLVRSWAAAPTWQLGATANAAFRARAVRRPDVGLLPEWLGPGTPTGVGEDTYLFYRILKVGLTAVYEPTAFVWHRHRREDRALRRQLYSYSSGHAAYLVTLALREQDLRGLARVAVHLPVHHLRAIVRWIRGDRAWPATLIATEIAGNLAAPWLLWRSFRRARRLARSNHER